MSDNNDFFNNFIRGDRERERAKNEEFAKRLFGDKKSDDYIKGYQEGAKMATERAIENLNKKLGIEDKQDD
jgi:hypothetical protein